MPIYEIERNGVTIELDSPTPPTRRQLDEAFARVSSQQATSPSLKDQVVSGAVDLAKGAGAGLASTVFKGGDLIRRATGMERVITRPEVQAGITPPESLAGRVGFGGEQIAEFFLPTGIVGKGAKAAEVAKSAGLTYLQSGSPQTAAVSGAITAAIPGGGALRRASSGFQQGAEKTVTQALGATKEWAKSDAARLAPQMLERGVRGSRAAMLEQAKATAASVGQQLDDAYRAAAASGQTVNGVLVRGHVQLARDAMKVRDAQGALAVIPGTERVIQQMDRLDEFIGTLGDDIPIDKAAAVKRVWDRIVSKAGLFGPKATASATDSADAFAIREASGAFRELLNRSPTIADLNAESAFWIGLKKVLRETQKRTQAQSGGLVAAGTGGAGAVVGALSGDSMSDKAQKAILGGLAGRQLIRLLQSPAWRTAVSAPAKHALAEALASGNAERLSRAVGRILAAAPSVTTRDISQPPAQTDRRQPVAGVTGQGPSNR